MVRCQARGCRNATDEQATGCRRCEGHHPNAITHCNAHCPGVGSSMQCQCIVGGVQCPNGRAGYKGGGVYPTCGFACWYGRCTHHGRA